MSSLHDELFGSDSDDEGEVVASSSTPKQQNFDVDDLFGSDSETEPEPSPQKQVSRLKKSGDKPPKQKKAKKSADDETGRAQKRPRPDQPSSSGASGGDAYDSGEDVQATAEDADFLASDDDLDEIRKEYDAEHQNFNDTRDDTFDHSDDEGAGGGGQSSAKKSSKSVPSEKVDAKSTNMIDQAILAGRKKKVQDMKSEDKQVLVTTLLEKMDGAWRRDMDALGCNPPRPAVHKLAMLDKVERLLKQQALHETLLDFSILEMLRNWLQPWPLSEDDSDKKSGGRLPLAKRTLPNLTLRSRLYGCLQNMPIRPEHLKNSERGGPGLGKVVIMLLQHPGETSENKRQLKAMLEEWSRHIFHKTKDFKQLPKTLRESAAGAKRPGAGAPTLRRSSSEAADDYLGGSGGQDAVDTTRVVRPFRTGYDFKVKPSAQTVEPVKVGKLQSKKNDRSRKAKETKRKLAMGSKRGEAPLHRVDL